MKRTHALAIMTIFLSFAFPHLVFAQNDLQSNTGVIDVTYICDTVNGDDGCYLEGFAVIYGDTNSTNLHGLSQTSVSADSFDDGWDGFVVGDVLQDGVEIAGPTEAGDNGQGVSAIVWNAAMNLNTPHTFDVRTDSYYNYMGNGGCAGGGTCYYIASAQQAVTLGRPAITSISPPYVFVGTAGTLTLNGSNFVNPFGNPTSINSSKTGGTGFSVSTGTVNNTQATAPYTASLTATTGNWDIGLSYALGSSVLVSTFGSFTVGDPTPTISSISPSTWAAGQVNIPVTIKGSGFGSNPALVIAGATSTITGHSDNGQPGGAVITANVSVPGCGSGSAVVTVTSTGYNGTGFVNAYPGQLSYVLATATITPSPAGTPNILFKGSNIAGKTTNVVVGQQINLASSLPTQACTTIASQNWSLPGQHSGETAVGGASASTASGFTLQAVPSNISSANYGPFYWVYPGSFPMTYQYTLVNGVTSPTASATFNVKGGGLAGNTAYPNLTADNLLACNGTPAGPWMVYGNIQSDPNSPCKALYPGSTFGMVFNPSGAQSASTYSYVQIIDVDNRTENTIKCTTSQGVDKNYPYSGILPNTNPPQAEDAPGVPLASGYTVSRTFTATMFLLWTPSAPSITVPLGYQTWAFTGSATCPNTKDCTKAKNWTVTTTGKPGPVGSFVTSKGSQTSDGYTQLKQGYPYWTGPAAETCN